MFECFGQQFGIREYSSVTVALLLRQAHPASKAGGVIALTYAAMWTQKMAFLEKIERWKEIEWFT